MREPHVWNMGRLQLCIEDGIHPENFKLSMFFVRCRRVSVKKNPRMGERTSDDSADFLSAGRDAKSDKAGQVNSSPSLV
jgi:hypothetical protein